MTEDRISNRSGARPTLGQMVTPLFLSAFLIGCAGDAPKSKLTATQQFEKCRIYASPLYSGTPSFDSWMSRLRRVARRCGIRRSTIRNALSGVTESALFNDRQLADASRGRSALRRYRNRTNKNMVLAYLEKRINDGFVEKGRELLKEHRSKLSTIEARYNFPAEYIIAYWGIETNYGTFTGRHPVIRTLARLGWQGRRRKFFSTELLAALIILDRRYARKSDLYGSFAGAMGQPQFMPSSYLYYAVDHNGDGRRDIWRNHGDIFASVANYNIKRGKWDTLMKTAILEVKLPRDFPIRESGFYQSRPTSYWKSLGVRMADGRPFPDDTDQSVIYMPAGCKGPAFLLPRNFTAILRYNNLIEYGFAVSVLAERIRGGFRIYKPWPQDDYPLTRSERRELQWRLTKLRYGDLASDGILGKSSRRAILKFQLAERMCPDSHANLKLLRRVRSLSRGRGRTVSFTPKFRRAR